MRGLDDRSEGMFSYVRLEERIPADHPLWAIRELADQALAQLNERFEVLYSRMGRPSIAPEMLLRATLLQAFFSVRSERLLMEQIDYNLLFRWFVGLPIDAPVWHATVFNHNRDRLLESDVAREFLAALVGLPQVEKLLSSEHFSADGALIDGWASMKSFRPKDGSGEPPSPGRNGERDFHNEIRAGDTLYVWRLDRLGRNLAALIRTVTELENRKLGLASITEKIDTSSSSGRLVFHVVASLAEFERNLIRERTIAGLKAARARTQGRSQAIANREGHQDRPRTAEDERDDSRGDRGTLQCRPIHDLQSSSAQMLRLSIRERNPLQMWVDYGILAVEEQPAAVLRR